MTMAKIKVERSSGNVFVDLAFADAEQHKLKSGLVAKLSHIIRSKGLTQSAAAKITGISQPDLSRLLRGHFRDFSVDRLIRVITELDSEVEIKVRHAGREVGDPICVHA